jgi:Uma2 family endonuclease
MMWKYVRIGDLNTSAAIDHYQDAIGLIDTIEPELHFILDTEITVANIASWCKERLPSPSEGHKIQVVLDWVFEMFSPSTKITGREGKMPLYAAYGVRFAWLIDPKTHTSEAYELADAKWRPLAIFRDDDTVCGAPFDQIVIHLADLWH